MTCDVKHDPLPIVAASASGTHEEGLARTGANAHCSSSLDSIMAMKAP